MHLRALQTSKNGNKMGFFLDDNGVLEYTQTNIPKPSKSDAQQIP